MNAKAPGLQASASNLAGVEDVMTVWIRDKKLLFVSAPKVACTSIKQALFEVENGFEFRNFVANGELRHIHDLSIYPALPFSSIPHESFEGYLKTSMVRHPVKRFLSAYSNRVVFYEELSDHFIGAEARKLCIPTNPTLSEFVEHLFLYRSISKSIWLHTQGLCYFLGSDATYYDRLFDISQMDDFSTLISAHLGFDFNVPHLQTGGPKISMGDLSGAETRKIIDFYANDYEHYGHLWR